MTDATPDMKMVHEETFGPIGCVTPFSSLEDAIAKSNATVYGLAASVWTSDVGAAQAMMRGLKAGMVGTRTFGAGACSAEEDSVRGILDAYAEASGSDGMEVASWPGTFGAGARQRSLYR